MQLFVFCKSLARSTKPTPDRRAILPPELSGASNVHYLQNLAQIDIMNAPQTGTVAAWANRSLGWVAELVGRAAASPELASMGRNRQLRATVTLRCAKVKVDANKSMRSWKLPNTSLLNMHATEDIR